MADPKQQATEPPAIRYDENSQAEISSLADALEWFLMYDERTARIRHPATEEVFQWKQQEDKVNGVNVYPFENAEARFAVGVFQALETNPNEESLHAWITQLLQTIQESREMRTELSTAYDLDADADASQIERSQRLTSNAEKRMYLTSCWLETLCTAEVRFLGWVFQQYYGKPFAP